MGGIATTVYSVRNFGKASHGDVGRMPAAIAQSVNSLSQATQSILTKVDNLGRWAKVGENATNMAANVSKLASKVTNPLLVGAAGVRILRDDDKESALIEEACAMGGMFASESAYKIVRNTITKNMGKTLKEGQKILAEGSISDIATQIGQKCSKLSSGKQKAVFILAELGLVGISIGSYSLFKKLGEKLTGRDKQNIQESPQIQEIKQPENIQTQNNGFLTLSSKPTAQNSYAITNDMLTATQAGTKIY